MPRVSSHFDGGAIDVVDVTRCDDLKVALRADSHADFRQWFYFRLQGAAQQPTRVRFVNAAEATYVEGIGLAIVCGGREGVMEAVCRGAARHGGIAIGILPDIDPSLANSHVTISLATGLGEARNAVIARAALALIAIGDSYGTLSEVALGLHFGKRVFGLKGAAQIAGVEHVASADAALNAIALHVLATRSA